MNDRSPMTYMQAMTFLAGEADRLQELSQDESDPINDISGRCVALSILLQANKNYLEQGTDAPEDEQDWKDRIARMTTELKKAIDQLPKDNSHKAIKDYAAEFDRAMKDKLGMGPKKYAPVRVLSDAQEQAMFGDTKPLLDEAIAEATSAVANDAVQSAKMLKVSQEWLALQSAIIEYSDAQTALEKEEKKNPASEKLDAAEKREAGAKARLQDAVDNYKAAVDNLPKQEPVYKKVLIYSGRMLVVVGKVLAGLILAKMLIGPALIAATGAALYIAAKGKPADMPGKAKKAFVASAKAIGTNLKHTLLPPKTEEQKLESEVKDRGQQAVDLAEGMLKNTKPK